MATHRTGASRLQYGLFATPLEDMIDADNPVRVIDAFVDVLDLKQLGFRHLHPARRGAPAFHPGMLLKLYLYGYFNRIRSSRRLAFDNASEAFFSGCVLSAAVFSGGRTGRISKRKQAWEGRV